MTHLPNIRRCYSTVSMFIENGINVYIQMYTCIRYKCENVLCHTKKKRYDIVNIWMWYPYDFWFYFYTENLVCIDGGWKKKNGFFYRGFPMCGIRWINKNFVFLFLLLFVLAGFYHHHIIIFSMNFYLPYLLNVPINSLQLPIERQFWWCYKPKWTLIIVENNLLYSFSWKQ